MLAGIVSDVTAMDYLLLRVLQWLVSLPIRPEIVVNVLLYF